ncbi:MAG: peptidoglycan DD-metalloendopeptidase family protein [Candidatus Wallbacteria bacterium]|nr:peptidoglycan DD-metalloendopeptidase family protein [Candidatus Wallbacteria bacterium]
MLTQGCRRSPRKGRTAYTPAARTKTEARTRSGSDHYVVKKGDSLWGIAQKTGISIADLREYNGISEGQMLKTGQKIYFPPSTGGKVKTAAVPQLRKTTETKVLPTQESSLAFRWPVDGKVISAFGEKLDGIPNKGIEIQAPPLAAYVSVADGEVIFSSPMENHGVVTIIKHAENFYSLYYAYHSKALVVKGDLVRSGQPIGYVGKKAQHDESGILHFEFRKRDAAVNPLAYLPKKAK